MQPPCFAMAHHLRAGHRLVLRVTTSDPDKVPMFAEDVQVNVFTGPGATSVDLPVVQPPTLYPDTVPLTRAGRGRAGPAQAPISSRTPPPGASVVTDVDGVTSQFVEYLQRRQADGTWSGDIASGAAGELTGETMTTARLSPGTYRIEVHDWAGPAGNQMAVNATFYNSAGEPGT
jgi:hypothetical protein